MTRDRPARCRREYKPNRRKLEFQTGVTGRIEERAQSTSELSLAYTLNLGKGCPR